MANSSSNIINTKYIAIELTQGKFAIIDSDKYPKINHIKNWCAFTKDDKNFYAQGKYKGETFFLHNLIMDHIPSESNSELTVDHSNRQTLFNTMKNLRIVTKSIQNMNKGLRWDNESGYNGVYCENGYWIASWVEDNEEKKQRFSIKQYGEERAYEIAVEYRLLKEICIPEYIEALSLFEKLDYFDFENIYHNPDLTIIFKNGLRSTNTSGEENITFIRELNKPTKYLITYYNEFGKRAHKTFTETNEETKPVYQEMIDFQNKMLINHPKTKRELEKKLSNKKELHKKLLNKKKLNNKNVKTK